MDDSGNIQYFNEQELSEKLKEKTDSGQSKWVELNNGDVLKHTIADRYFLVISITEPELKVRPISNSYALELIVKRQEAQDGQKL